MLTLLLSYIRSITKLSDESWELLLPTLTTMKVEKETFLLKPKEYCTAIFFISEGYCRTFYNKDGEEINTGFYLEQEFATNLKSVVNKQRSEYAIQACEPLSLVRFDTTKLQGAYLQSHEIETMGRKMLAMIAARQEQHLDMFKLLNAKQRYEYMQTHQPALLQRISLTQLSSYLGVSRETLSRIRRRIARK